MRSFGLMAILAVLVVPAGVGAIETGRVVEDFGTTGRRNERATYAFWDTRSREVSLPLNYTFSKQEGTLDSGAPQIRFAEVADEFRRIPAGRIRDEAAAASDVRFRYTLSNGALYTSLGGGIALNGGRVAELKGLTLRAIASGGDHLLLGWTQAGKAWVGEIALQGFAPSAAVETTNLTTAGYNRVFTKATLTVEAEVLEGTRIEYFLSADKGVHFESVIAGVEHEFVRPGRELRARAVLFTDNITTTPYLRKFTVAFVKDEVETVSTIRARDNRRISDLRTLSDKLEKFKRERGVYPIVDDQYPRVRWAQLGQLLIDGKYLTIMPEDPRRAQDNERLYDYISSKTGNAYVLRARLDENGARSLEKDVDGQPVEPHLYDYTCDDPWYCVGKGIVVAVPHEAPPEPRGNVELLQADDGKVWRIAMVGGGPYPEVERKLYIPSPSLLERLKTFYTRMQRVGKDEIDRVPRVRLVKTADKNDVYYLTETWLKRRLPSWEVFLSYGNAPHEIAVVNPEELEAYGESRLIRLVGDSRVWHLEGGVRRLVRTPEVMRTRGFKWEHVAPVNFPEYNSYPAGQPLE